MLMLYTFKSGSSVLFVISSAVALPLSDVLYTSSFIAGSSTVKFTIFDGSALLILIVSIVIYYSKKEERAVVDEKTHKVAKFVPSTPMLDGNMSERAHHLNDHYSQPEYSHRNTQHLYGISAEVP